jgi:hypothetical protein
MWRSFPYKYFILIPLEHQLQTLRPTMILLSQYIPTLKTVPFFEMRYSEPPNITFLNTSFIEISVVKLLLTCFNKWYASWGCIFIITPIVTALVFPCCSSLDNSLYLNCRLYNVLINKYDVVPCYFKVSRLAKIISNSNIYAHNFVPYSWVI